ncbi:hypothetical protein ATY79_28560 [Rhizobium sp. R693]|nr:hypothetical protein ATY79_28560 [Rhizobium sp. R693]
MGSLATPLATYFMALSISVKISMNRNGRLIDYLMQVILILIGVPIRILEALRADILELILASTRRVN